MLLHFIAIFIGTDFDLCLTLSLTDLLLSCSFVKSKSAVGELVDVVGDIFCIIMGNIFIYIGVHVDESVDASPFSATTTMYFGKISRKP